MEDDSPQLNELINHVDSTVERSDAKVLITPATRTLGWEIVGNRNGLLRLGVELMMTAQQMPTQITCKTANDLSYLGIAGDESVVAISRNEELLEPRLEDSKTVRWWWKWLYTCLFLVAWLLSIVSLIVGYITVTKSLVRWWFG